MPNLSGRTKSSRVSSESRGNVIWLTWPAREPKPRSTGPVASLHRSVAALSREIERSGKLNSEIAAAIDAGRYELYKVSVSSGASADRSLVRAQGVHLSRLLRFVHGVAAAGSDERASERQRAARLDALARNIRELQASLARARALSRTVLEQAQRRDWSGRVPELDQSSR